MDIQHKEQAHSGSFFISQEGSKLAEATYTMDAPGTVTINHTHVNASLRGEGTGASLIEALAQWARTNNYKVDPQCSFARALFTKRNDWQDLLAHH